MKNTLLYTTLVAAYLALLGVQACQFFAAPPDVQCTGGTLSIDRDQCLELENPCGADWVRGDALLLDGNYPGLSLTMTRAPRVWSLCANAEAPAMDSLPVDFTYIDPDGNKGNATMEVSLGFDVEINVTPLGGGTYQLLVLTTGGVAPFTFVWADDPTLSSTNIHNPIASPVYTTEYVVTVTDSALGSVPVVSSTVIGVPLAITATADPSIVEPGETVQLEANVTGGRPPYVFAWSPEALVSDPSIFNPTAAPVQSTAFTARVTDDDGIVRSDNVSVTVDGNDPLTANPSTNSDPNVGTVELSVSPSGGTPPYEYLWDTGETSDSITVSPPVTSDYTITVDDSVGATILTPMEAIVACFEFVPSTGEPPTGSVIVELHPECTDSHPPTPPLHPLQYYWWLNWDAADDPETIDLNTAYISSTAPTFVFFLDSGGQPDLGLHHVALIAVDSLGNRYFQQNDYIAE